MEKTEFSKENISEVYSTEFNNLLRLIKTEIIQEHPSIKINIDYMILSILEDKECLANILLNQCLGSMGLKNIHEIYYDLVHSISISAIKPNREISFTDDLWDIIFKANEERSKLNDKYITTEHIILALLSAQGKAKDAFILIGFSYSLALSKIKESRGISDNSIYNEAMPKKDKKSYNSVFPIEEIPIEALDIFNTLKPQENANAVNNYCINLNELAKSKKIDNIVGRDEELKNILRILSRRKRNNVIIVGESGVGKTSLINGLAYKINQKKVPQSFINKEIIMLDINALMSGTQFRGIFEEKMNALYKALKKNKKYILFLDDIHSLIGDKGKGDVDISSSLMPFLNDSDIQIIGVTNFREYRSSIEKNSNISQRFQKIILNESSISDTIKILSFLKKLYEKHHNVIYELSSIESCAKLAKRYIKERKLPDSAIDIMDEVGANAKMNQYNIETNDEIIDELENINFQKEEALKSNNIKKYDDICEKIESKKIKLAKLNKKSLEKEPTHLLDKDVAKIISTKTGISASNLEEDSKKRYLNLANNLKKEIIGQDNSINKICNALKRKATKLNNPNKPVVLFIGGPTGVGKTYTAKKLAKYIFGSEDEMIRLDMSEYSEKSSISKIVGSAPGYVGFESTMGLSEQIKNKKYCILLLDEFEKCATEVQNVFLQIFDDGTLTDSSGYKIDFSNTIILLTSNAGVKDAIERGNGIGLDENKKSFQQFIEKGFKRMFAPEIINRFDDIIYFDKLTDDSLSKIIEIQLNNINNSIFENYNSKLSKDFFSQEIISYIINHLSSNDKLMGARPINRVIDNLILSSITDIILEKNLNNYEFQISIKNNDIYIK